jgi:hypothetical protein
MASDVSGKVAGQQSPARQSGKKYGFFIVPGHQLKGAPCRVLGVDVLLQAPIVEDYRMLAENASTPRKATYQPHDVPLSGIVSSPDSWRLEGGCGSCS